MGTFWVPIIFDFISFKNNQNTFFLTLEMSSYSMKSNLTKAGGITPTAPILMFPLSVNSQIPTIPNYSCPHSQNITSTKSAHNTMEWKVPAVKPILGLHQVPINRVQAYPTCFKILTKHTVSSIELWFL